MKAKHNIQKNVISYNVISANGLITTEQSVSYDGTISVPQPKVKYDVNPHYTSVQYLGGMELIDYEVHIVGNTIECKRIDKPSHRIIFNLGYKHELVPYDYNYNDTTFDIDWLSIALQNYIKTLVKNKNIFETFK